MSLSPSVVGLSCPLSLLVSTLRPPPGLRNAQHAGWLRRKGPRVDLPWELLSQQPDGPARADPPRLLPPAQGVAASATDPRHVRWLWQSCQSGPFPSLCPCPSYAMPLMVPGSRQGLGARPGFPPPPFQDVCLAGRRGILQPVPHQLRAKSQTGSLVELVTPGSSWGPQRGVLPWRQGC